MRKPLTGAKTETFFLCGLFAALVFYTMPRMALVAIIGTLLANLLESRKMLVIAVMNVLVGALLHALSLNVDSFWLFDLPSAGALAVSAGIFLAALAFFALYMAATIALPRHLTVLLLVAIVVGLSSRYFALSESGQGLARQLIRGVWFNGFYLLQVRRLSDIRVMDFLVCQRPFFAISSLPVPPLLSQFIVATAPEERAVLRRSAVGLLMASALCHWGVSYIDARVPFSFDSALYLALPVWARWGVVLHLFARHLLATMALLGPGIAVCLMMGIRLQSPVGNLLRARAFYDFLYTTNRYYAAIVVDLFIDPAYRALHFLRRAPRQFAAVMIGLIAAGVAFHSLRVAVYDIFNNLPRAIAPRIGGASIYWALLAVAACLSIAWEKRGAGETEPAVRRALRVSAYAVFNAVLLLLAADFAGSAMGWLDRLELVRRLFTP